LSDIDIVHRLEILMRYRCTALHSLSVAYATQELKKTGYAYPTTCGASAECTDRSFFQNTVKYVFGSQADSRIVDDDVPASRCFACEP
jgi:hypothetical protein